MVGRKRNRREEAQETTKRVDIGEGWDVGSGGWPFQRRMGEEREGFGI